MCSYTWKKWVPLLLSLKSDSYLGTIHIWRPWELSNFQDPSPSLSSYVQYSSIPLTLAVQFETNTPLPPLSLSPNDNQSIKRKHNPRMTMICYQVFPSGRLFFFSINSLTCLAFHWLLSVQLKATSSPELFKNIKNLFFAFLFKRNDVLGQGWAETWLSAFSGLYILACAVVQKYHEISFIYNYSHF